MSNEFAKQRVLADQQALAQNLNTLRGQLVDVEAQAAMLREQIANHTGAVQYAGALLQQIDAQEKAEEHARREAEERARRELQAKLDAPFLEPDDLDEPEQQSA